MGLRRLLLRGQRRKRYGVRHLLRGEPGVGAGPRGAAGAGERRGGAGGAGVRRRRRRLARFGVAAEESGEFAAGVAGLVHAGINLTHDWLRARAGRWLP